MNNLHEQLQPFKDKANTQIAYYHSHVRNACAHHSRIWNKTLGVGFEVPRNNQIFDTLLGSRNKIFFALTVIEYILGRIGEDEVDFKSKLKGLLGRYPDVDIKAMGFVDNWEELEIWG